MSTNQFRRGLVKLAMLSIVLAPGFAYAHAMLEAAVPPVGSSVHAAPRVLQLEFSEAVEPRFCAVSVDSAQGAAVTAGRANTDPGDAKRLLVPLSTLVPGIYTVTWHAVSVDTHRTQGSFHFTVVP